MAKDGEDKPPEETQCLNHCDQALQQVQNGQDSDGEALDEEPPPIPSNPPPDVNGEEKENYQGPHNWRKGLKPVQSPAVQELKRQEGDSARVIRRKSSKEDRLEVNRIRERMRAKHEASGRNKGPVVAKINIPPLSNLQIAGNLSPSSIKRRHSYGNHLDSPFTRQVVKQERSPGTRRKTSSFNAAKPADKKHLLNLPLNLGRRAASPNLASEASIPNASSVRRRVDKVMKARLYLLQQMGPNSFFIGGDSPDHKFRVIIGPQKCSCGRGPHCVHILFVMLRVFQVKENNPCLWSKTLKNYEVESLFHNFHARRTSRIQELMKKKIHPPEVKTSEGCDHDNEDASSTATEEAEADKEEEEETCPICLLEMVEGESLVQCDNGCQNKLHHHCIDVWFQECRRQDEPLNCPLCRAKWKKQDGSSSELLAAPSGEDLPVPPNTRASSPSPQDHDQEIPMPQAEPIPQEHMSTASKWIPVIGEDITACLFSKNWAVREIALKKLSESAVGALLLGVGEGRSGVVLSPTRQATTHSMLECCCSVLAFICADPVYKVFVAALRTLRTVLSYTPCRDVVQQARLQNQMSAVIHTILWKCADSNRRTSQLSISALQELVKGQSGELAVGKEIVNPGQHGLGGLEYLVRCITENSSEQEVQWQWLLGRLYMVDRLLDEYQVDFIIHQDDHDDSDISRVHERVFSVLKFSMSVMTFPHSKVSKMARRVFFLLAKLQAQNRSILKEISDILEGVDVTIQAHLRRKLWRVAEEYNQQEKELDRHESGDGRYEGPLTPTPVISAASTPRSASPLTIDSSLQPHSSNTIAAHNILLGHFGAVPIAPPNSPNNKRQRVASGASGNHDAESISSGDVSFRGKCADCDTMRRLHSPMYRLSPQGQSVSDLEQSPRIQQRRSHVEVADACVATSPRLRRGYRRNLTGTVGNFLEREDDGNEEDNEDEGDEDTGVDDPDRSLAHPLDISVEDIQVETECVPEMIMPVEAKPVFFPNEPAYSTVEDSDTHPEGIVRNTKRRTKTPKLKRKSRLSDPYKNKKDDGEPMEDNLEQPKEKSPEGSTSESETSHDIVGRSTSINTETQTLDMKEDAGTQTDDDDLSSANATINTTHAAYFTEDLSDLTLSHNEEKISFKDEVARASPKHNGASNEECPCKEEVEKEEAKALVEALEKSTLNQGELPHVPGLTRTDSTETLTIHIQDEENGSTTSEYQEDNHWKRGCILGTGAFSTCYQARDIKTGTLMAVKQISFCRNSISEQEKVVEAVREEILMMAKLNHPNIVRILGATQQGCHFFMFVEWMPGGSVAYLLDRYGVFTEQVLISYTFQVLHGLAYLHENHILHRDLKGANLLVDSTGQRVRIADFGASARLATRQTGAGEFQGQLLGTIAFMAPEVLRGESYGRSCDIWSVGCVIVEMATSKPPWGAHDISNHLALIFKIASTNNPPPVPESMSPPVKDLMLRCLEPSREDRPSAKDLLKHPVFTMYTHR